MPLRDELLEALELFYRTFFLGEDGEKSGEEEK